MDTEKRFISSEILFSAIKNELSNNRRASFIVTGMSMWPFLCHGRDSVTVEAADAKKLKIGDIVLFEAIKGKYILHRITKLYDDSFETTGDGNFFRDGKFPFEAVVGKAVKISRNGKAIDCDSLLMKVFAKIWTALFPVRKQIFKFWFKIRKYVRK